MMTDKRSFDGWRRLSRAVMTEVATDDPGGLAEVRKALDEMEALWVEAMRALNGKNTSLGVKPDHPYSLGEIGADLGISRQAVAKRIGRD